MIRVPRRSGRSSQPWSLKNWLARSTVYGGYSALMGWLFGYFFLFRFAATAGSPDGLLLLALFGVVPGVVGFLGGERAVNLLGQLARSMARSSYTSGGCSGGC